jgi:hypothetical protein
MQLLISRSVAEKLEDKHNLTALQVREAVERVSGLEGSWDNDRERGLRVILETEIEGMTMLVVLYPADDLGFDIWRLGSAYCTDETDE